MAKPIDNHDTVHAVPVSELSFLYGGTNVIAQGFATVFNSPETQQYTRQSVGVCVAALRT